MESKGDVLLLSMRKISDLVAYSMTYEFEDVVADVAGGDRIDALESFALSYWRKAYKYLRLTSGSRRVAQIVTPSPATVTLTRDYELFLPVFNGPHDVWVVNSISNWRQRCRLAACVITEAWLRDMPEYLLELLGQFDHIFLGMRNGMEVVAKVTGRPVHHLPMAADVVRFSPWPDPPVRCFDVCNVGRRSAITHAALVELARKRKISYYFDTFAGGVGKYRNQRTFRVENAAEHRLLLSTLLRRSRYYLASRSRINQPEYGGAGPEEMAVRFYEGTASGCVLLGEAPRCEEFHNQLDWPDAVIPMPFNAPDVARTLEEFDADPERIARIGRTNASNAARKNDWLHRVQLIFDTVGMPHTESMRARQAQLEHISRMASAG
jgi:hypothetical protein